MTAIDCAGERLLTPHELKTARAAIARESEARHHVVVYLSGAHAYGFPSPDSDLDLKAVHLAPTDRVLGLQPPRPTVDRTEVVDGVEIDYTSNELGHVLAGILGGNGNFLERILGPSAFAADPDLLGRLRALRPAYLSRRAHAHYRGFARQQHKSLDKRPTVKRLLYVLRTLSTGIWLLERGELVVDFPKLAPELGLDDALALVERKRAGERIALDDATRSAWEARIEELFRRIETARETSVLPEAPPDPDAVNALLVEIRLSALASARSG